MTPLVSIIVPIYNVEAYLHRCVSSLRNQTVANIEIILVDDGSPDSCPDICNQLADEDARIRVIHKQNGGLSSARNAGMKEAKGEYILFVDSDDWIDTNTVEELTAIAEKHKVDFVRFRPMHTGWPNVTDGTLCDFGTEQNLSEKLYTRAEIETEVFPRLFGTPQLTLGCIVSACRSLYRTSFITQHQLFFLDEVKYSEDSIFSAMVLRACNSFYYLDGPRYYHYFYNPSSITKSFRKDRWDSCKKLMSAFDNYFLGKKDFDWTHQLQQQKLYCIESALAQRAHIADKQKRIRYCKEVCDDPVTIQALKSLPPLKISLKHRIFLYLIRNRLSRIIAAI